MVFLQGKFSSSKIGFQNHEQFMNNHGEHPLGEHPSRTLFVRNINSNVEDEELTSMFEVRKIDFRRGK